MNLIKVNLPRNRDDFIGGNGEGVWVSVSEDVVQKDSDNLTNVKCIGKLENDSIYYPALKVGMEVIFELRGENRAVALIDEFLDRYEAISDEELEDVKRKIWFENMMKTVRKKDDTND